MHRRHTKVPAAYRRTAFTAMEVLMALSLSVVIGMCLMTLAGTARDAWQSQEQESAQQIAAARSRHYMERVVLGARDIGYWNPGTAGEPATLLLWVNDLFNSGGASARDQQPQQAELLLIQYDQPSQSIRLYRTRPWAQLSSGEQLLAATPLTLSQLNSKSAADGFRTASSTQQFILVGDAETKVASATFNVLRDYDRPILQYQFNLLRNGRPLAVSGTVGLRTPHAEDDWSGIDLIAGAMAEASLLPAGGGSTCTDVSSGGSTGSGGGLTFDGSINLFDDDW